MQVTKIIPQKRYANDGPAVFAFHSNFGTVKTDQKLVMTAKDKVGIYRPRASITLPREKEGALIVCAEQAEFRKAKELYVLYEFKSMDAGLLLDHLLEVRELMHIDQIYSRLTNEESHYLSWRNTELRGARKKDLLIGMPPLANTDGCLEYHLNVLKDLSRPGKERLFFREGSNLPQELAQMPDQTFMALDTHYPMLGALAYVVAAMSMYETLEPDSREATRKDRAITEYDIFADRDGDYDIFRGL